MMRMIMFLPLLSACSIADYTAEAVKEKVIREEIIPELREKEAKAKTKSPAPRRESECSYVNRGGITVKECE